MKIPFSALKKHLDINISPEEISKTLTLAGIEVEAIEHVGSNFTGVVTAKVIKTEQHPNADRLKVALVFDGTNELQIVCGAQNCRAGIITALARVGATLPPDESGKPLKIKKGKLRDVESFGMLCGADELGLTDASEGIMELAEDTPLGTDLTSLYGDCIFDISLTPNLGHCLSFYGLARELSALLNIPLKPLYYQPKESSPSIHTLLSAKIEDKTLCHRYMARLAQSVQVAPSPEWLKRKVEYAGIRSINNVVDIASFVMLVTGQPLHMFDYDLIQGHTLTVAAAKEESTTTTLDGIERKTPKDALMIYDSKSIVAIAGVMGGQNSCVTDKTTNIIIESAHFLPQSIRKTSKELGLKTDASYRFERGVDPLALPKALDMAAELLEQIASATICEGAIDINEAPHIPKKIYCRTERVQRILGIEISQREIASIFDRLSIRIAKEGEGVLEAIIPSFRNDLSSEIDLIEEVARLYGYNKIPRENPMHISSSLLDAPIYTFENLVRDRLISEGLQEMITCDLISPALADLTKEPSHKDIHLLRVMQSKSNDYSVLRPSLLPGLISSIKHNKAHQTHTLACFEVGRVHFERKQTLEEISCVGIALTGLARPFHHSPKTEEVDFFDLKGIVENLLSFLKIDEVQLEQSHLHNFQPGRQARIMHRETALGVIGQLHPSTLQGMDIDQKVYYAEINLHELMPIARRNILVKALDQFPGSERDWTLTVKKHTPIAHILHVVKEQKTPLLQDVFILGLFESEKLGEDRKNVTLRFSFRDKEKTLSYEEVEAQMAKLTQKVAEKLHDCLL